MNDKEYWQTRAEQRLLMGEKTAEELLMTMKPVYQNSLADINKEIEAFYGRYAENNNLSLAEVHKRLDPKQLRTAKYEIKKYYDAVDKLARKSDGTVDVELLKQYKDELRLLSARAYMSRLDDLKLRLKNITVNLGVKESEAYYRTLEKIYSNNYSKVNFDLDKFFGWSAGFEGLNYKKLNTAIHQQWLGMNFSDRIWNNKGKLIDQINTTFLQGVAQGHNPRKIAESMAKNMGTAYYNCERLARTECAHIAGEATLQGYKDRGTDKYKFEATLDGRTSDICQSLDGEVFNVKEAQAGVNYPPMHPNCRSTTIPYFEPDEIDKMFDEAQRVARNEDGELYYVPESMNYKQWKESMQNPAEEAIQYPILTENPKSEIRTYLENFGVECRKVDLLPNDITEDEIINRLAGGDKTEGSCSSLSFAYVANKSGFDVLDFRDGQSRKTFATTKNILKMAKFNGVESYFYESSNDLTSAKKLFEKVELDKQYVFVVGRHSAIIKSDNGVMKYLELQSSNPNANGWRNLGIFQKDIERTLKHRFACQKSHTYYGRSYKTSSCLIEIESLGKNAEFVKLMQYVNTAENQQMKGIGEQ